MAKKKIPVTKIDSSVPLPDESNIYPFRHMDIGDSFALNISHRARVASAASVYARRSETPIHFTVRKIDSNTIRVWRDK